MSLALAAELAERRRTGTAMASICSAHPLVVEAALAAAGDAPVLVEATCNQVNQEGGYTGMRPDGFRRHVEGIARSIGFDPGRLILGGDHLGPNPWKRLDAETAMSRAERMVEAYVEAGFGKLHLDASMGCRGEPAALPPEIVAARAARLAAVAERTAERCGLARPVYVIGTEVPPPGGALHPLDAMEVTEPAAVLETHDLHRRAFARAGIGEAFARVVAIVVQPGVEFDHQAVVFYDPARSAPLVAVLGDLPGLVFEAHSTDYQLPQHLRALGRDGFAVLKVGPALTFALREALYGLDAIAAEFEPGWRDRSLRSSMERLMLDEPAHWQAHYRGSEAENRLNRHFGFSDRIRYYWPHPQAQAAVDRLMGVLSGRDLPVTLISQYLPLACPRVLRGEIASDPRSLILAAIHHALAAYCAAAKGA